MNANRKAFLDAIAHSELGHELLAKSDNGYDVLVGSTPMHMMLFKSYADHPRQVVKLSMTLSSTAAGRYQILARYFDAYKKQLNLPDFSSASQDAIAMQMIKECKALDNIDSGRFAAAIAKCASRWASLPGATYGQHVNKIAALQAAYQAAGGILA